MWSIVASVGPSDPKMQTAFLKGGYHTSASFRAIIGSMRSLADIPDKQFPNFKNRNPSELCHQNHQMDRPLEINSSLKIQEPIAKNNPIANSQGCNTTKKKKKKRRRKKKKNKNSQTQQNNTNVTENPVRGDWGGCRRQRQVSTTESEDSFVIFFDDTVDGNDRISELSENETEITEDFDSSDSIVPHKRVRFADDDGLCEIHPMIMWSYAYQAARKGPWEEYARDRDRFHKRVRKTEAEIGHVFGPEHRSKIYKERFA